MKILVTPRSFGKTDPEAFMLLERAGIEVVRNETGSVLTAGQLAKELADCEGVIIGVDPLNAEVLAAAPKLTAVAKYEFTFLTPTFFNTAFIPPNNVPNIA